MAALARTVYTSIELYFILFLLTLSVLFLGQHSFGFEEEDFKNFSYTSMTIFKMMIGRLVGVYYQLMVEISLAKAIIFVLPIILMKTIFLTVFLAVVAYEYEHNVLNQDFSSNINLLRSIFFCNISLDKRQQNKRAKELEEKEDMEKIGNHGENADKDDDKKSDDEDSKGLKIALTSKDGTKPVNGGLEIYNKMDIKF